MDIGLLGPLDVRHGDRSIPVTSAKQRTVLAVLALRVNEVVSAEQLIDLVWDGQPPATARSVLQALVMRLRRLLGPGVVVTRAPGYLLAVPPESVDVHRLHALRTAADRAAAIGDAGQEAEFLRQLTALRRGQTFADIASETLHREHAQVLDEQLTEATERRLAAELALSRHHLVLDDLRAFVLAHPVREHSRALLVTALHRAGRRAEALTAYEDARRTLAAELGVAPGPELRRAHAAALGEPDAAPPPATHPPAQLPADIGDFTGRADVIEQLTVQFTAAGAAPCVAVLSGMGGIGKTTLAVHAAHRLRARYPDGQLYAALTEPGGRPVPPVDVLGRFLRDLGAPERHLPAGLDARAARYRSLLADRRVLIVLDDAADAAQVRPLLPGTATGAVLVTSRNRLSGLAGSTLIELGVFGEAEARALFATVSGSGQAHLDPVATAEILAVCAGLPLAVRIAAARLAARPGWSPRTLADRLAEARGLLDQLSAGDLAVRASFEVSHRALAAGSQLEREAARAFGYLGWWQGPGLSLGAAAALLGLAGPDAEDRLETLVDAHLVQSAEPGRYTLHDLLRVYAAERAGDASSERSPALARLASYYLTAARDAVRDASLEPGPAHGHAPATAAKAIAWLDAERANLITAAALQHQLSPVLASYLITHSHYADAVRLHTLAVAATADDPAGHARALHDLGHAQLQLGEYDTALENLSRAAAGHARLGDNAREALALEVIGELHGQRGELGEALTQLLRAVELRRDGGDLYRQAGGLVNLGTAHGRLGDLDRAIAAWREALVLARQSGNRHAEGGSLAGLGIIYERSGQFDLALEHLHQARDLQRFLRARHDEGRTLNNLGVVYGRLGRYAEARSHFHQARQLHAEISHRASEGQSLSGLGTVCERLGDYEEAIAHHEAALAIGQRIGERNLQAQSLNGLGCVHHRRGEQESALARHTAALEIAQATGSLYQQAQAHEGIGHAQHALGQTALARPHWERALRTYTGMGAVEAEELQARLTTMEPGHSA
ncbi:AfsR/SARP family transcriptional regulator [Longispora albida]|uniref:AfsR/SARP family transcriptional regulator n=1 Tax=Longispora albida TaxID=203523 RepID=UPI00035EC305|nr:tetratricopeptide repeat protein [Longispora albida]